MLALTGIVQKLLLYTGFDSNAKQQEKHHKYTNLVVVISITWLCVYTFEDPGQMSVS